MMDGAVPNGRAPLAAVLALPNQLRRLTRAGVEALLKGGAAAFINELSPATARTALCEAVVSGNTAVAAMLLASGASPNIGHPEHGPPLLAAAADGSLPMVDLLIFHGARRASFSRGLFCGGVRVLGLRGCVK